MTPKLILLIGPMFLQKLNYERHVSKNFRYVLAENGLRGLATAVLVHPDAIICQDYPNFIPASYIKFVISKMANKCRFFIIRMKDR